MFTLAGGVKTLGRFGRFVYTEIGGTDSRGEFSRARVARTTNAAAEEWKNGNRVPGKSRGQPVLRPLCSSTLLTTRRGSPPRRVCYSRSSNARPNEHGGRPFTLTRLGRSHRTPRCFPPLRRKLHRDLLCSTRERVSGSRPRATRRVRARVIRPARTFTRSPTRYPTARPCERHAF